MAKLSHESSGVMCTGFDMFGAACWCGVVNGMIHVSRSCQGKIRGGELGLERCAFVVGDGGGGLGLEGGRKLVMGLADAECRVQLICCIQYELSLV